MSGILIDGYCNVIKEGVTLHFNQKVSMNGGLAADEWYVSWDRIGKGLLGEHYCDFKSISVEDLDKIRKLK